jgi:hypothetical protein
VPYVKRDESGQIAGLSERSDAEHTEFLKLDHPDITSLVQGGDAQGMRVALEASDLDMIRIIEDLIDVLISQNVINFTDLPTDAQNKLLARQQLRHGMSSLSNLIAEDDTIL